LLGTN